MKAQITYIINLTLNTFYLLKYAMDTIAGAFFANSNSCSHGKTRLGEGRVFIRRGEVNYSSESEPEPEPEPESEPESESPSDADSLRRDEVESETELEPESDPSDDSLR